MKDPKKILIVENDKTIRTELKAMLQDMKLEVLETDNGIDAKEKIETETIDLVITNLSLPELNGSELIKVIHRVNHYIKIIVISQAVNSVVYERIRKLQVYRLYQIPFDTKEIKEAVRRGLLSTPPKVANESSVTKDLEYSEVIRILVTHPDVNIFQKILEIGISKGYEVDYAKEADEFIRLITVSFYDIIIYPYQLMDILNPHDDSAIFRPILFVLSDKDEIQDKSVAASSHHTIYIPLHFTKSEFLQKLNEILPSYINARDNYFQDKETKENYEKVDIPHSNYTPLKYKVLKKPVLLLYLILILLAGLIGFWASFIFDSEKQETTQSPEGKMIRELKKYNDLQKLYEKQKN